MPRKPRDPPLQTASSKPLTSAERNARWRLAHDRRGAGSSTPAGEGTVCISPPELLVTCIPRGNVELDRLERSARDTMELYDKLVGIVSTWLDGLDVATLSPADAFTAFKLLAPSLESLAIIRAKIAEQRAAEARDVTAQMQTDLQEGVKREAPKIQETLELMRRRFDDIIKPKAN
jgi:hypothetical protein